MSVLNQYYKPITASSLLLAIVVGYLEFPGKKPTANASAERPPTAPSVAQASLRSASPAALEPEQQERASVRGLPAPSPEIQNLLPGLAEGVKNWKEFKPKKLV